MIDPAETDPNRGYKMFGFDEVFLIYTPLANWTVHKVIDEDISLNDKTREELFWQLLEGIEFLHSIEVMHRDIKPLNMTVVSLNPAHPEARLIDFGMATRGLESYDYMLGTRSYLAPEMWAGWENRTNDPYDERVDMFAFGLSMYQFFCQQPCGWERIDTENGEISSSTLEEIERRLFESRYRDGLMQLISLFIAWDPQDRPSARDAMRMGMSESARYHDQEERMRNDRERDEIEDSGIGSSMGGLSIFGAGRTSNDRSRRESLRGTSREYEAPSRYPSSPARAPTGWNASGNQRAYRSSRY